MTPTLAFHQLAEQKREQEHFLAALRLYEKVILLYQKEHNYYGLSQALQGRVLTYKHLFLRTQELSFLLIAFYNAKASLKIAKVKALKDDLHSCYFRLGEISILLQKYQKAIYYYHKALSHYSFDNAQRGDYLYHLGEAYFLVGNKETGKKYLFEGLKQLEQHPDDPNTFVNHVWLSGACLKIAGLLWSENPKEARIYFDRASTIINQDPQLIIRQHQLAEFKLKYGIK